jgi:hypothetical protein
VWERIRAGDRPTPRMNDLVATDSQ